MHFSSVPTNMEPHLSRSVAESNVRNNSDGIHFILFLTLDFPPRTNAAVACLDSVAQKRGEKIVKKKQLEGNIVRLFPFGELQVGYYDLYSLEPERRHVQFGIDRVF